MGTALTTEFHGTDIGFFTRLPSHARQPGFRNNLIEEWQIALESDQTLEILSTLLRKTSDFLYARGNADTLESLADDLDDMFEAWAANATPKLNDFSDPDLAAIIPAWAKMGVRPTAEFMIAWQDTATARLQDFTAEELADTLWGFAKYGVRPGEEFMAAWEKTATGRISEFDSRNLARAFWAMAAMAHKPDSGFLRAAQTGIERHIDHIHKNDLARSLWAAAIFDILEADKETTMAIAHTLHDKIGDFTFSDAGATQINSACLWLDLPCDLAVPDEIDHPSGMENRLRHLFYQCGFDISGNDGNIAELGNHKVDIPLLKKTGRADVFIEADGPSHFVVLLGEECPETPDHVALAYNGNTMLQTALISKLAVNAAVVRLPFTVVDKLLDMSREAAQKALKNLLEKVDFNEPGAYIADLYRQHRMRLEPVPVYTAAA